MWLNVLLSFINTVSEAESPSGDLLNVFKGRRIQSAMFGKPTGVTRLGSLPYFCDAAHPVQINKKKKSALCLLKIGGKCLIGHYVKI